MIPNNHCAYKPSVRHSKLGRQLLASILLSFGLLSCGPFKSGYESARIAGDEQILRTNLSNIRLVIRQYEVDRGIPPRSLSDVVDAGYINEIPIDPMTKKNDWVVVQYDCASRLNCKEGIKDVHSASTARSTKGDQYSTW
jgi:general secretion pathway protein G